jgi:hypothetical protein
MDAARWAVPSRHQESTVPNDQHSSSGDQTDRTPAVDRNRQATEAAGNDAGVGSRDKYRDNDDARAPLGGDDRQGTKADSRFEARGDARENVGNNARGTDAHPTGPSGNDKTKSRGDLPDEFDADLERDNHRGREAHHGMSDLAADTRAGMAGAEGAHGAFGHQGQQHDRQTQAASPAERGHDERPKKKDGHR